MELHTFLALAKKLYDMGDFVVDQLNDVVGGDDIANQNLTAISMIVKFLNEAHKAGIEDANDYKDEIESFLNKD